MDIMLVSTIKVFLLVKPEFLDVEQILNGAANHT